MNFFAAIVFTIFGAGYFAGNSVPRFVPNNPTMSALASAFMFFGVYKVAYNRGQKAATDDYEKKAKTTEAESKTKIKKLETENKQLKEKNNQVETDILSIINKIFSDRYTWHKENYLDVKNNTSEQPSEVIQKAINEISKRDERCKSYQARTAQIIREFNEFLPKELYSDVYRDNQKREYDVEVVTGWIIDYFKKRAEVSLVLNRDVTRYSFIISNSVDKILENVPHILGVNNSFSMHQRQSTEYSNVYGVRYQYLDFYRRY